MSGGRKRRASPVPPGAGGERAQPVPAGSVRGGEVAETVLSNGVRVLSEWLPGVRSVAVGVWVRQGSAYEDPHLMGISHMLEHLVFKGTSRRSAREIALALESLGGALDAYTSREHTSFQARVLDEHLPQALDVLADLVRNPLLRDEDLDLERKVILEEISTVEDTPDDLVFDLHNRELWGGHPYAHTILGTRETVSGVQRESLRKLHASRYLNGSLVVAGAGRVDHAPFVRSVEALFGDLPRGEDPPPLPLPEGSHGDVWVERETAQTHLVFGGAVPGHSDPRRYPLALLSAALGGGMSSRLFQRVREEMGLAYAVFTFQSFYRLAGVWGIYLGTAPATAETAVRAVREELEKVVEEGLPAEELARTKEQVKGQLILSQESTTARLYRLAATALYDEVYLTLDEVLDRLDAVTGEEVLEVAREFYRPDRLLLLRLGPRGG